MSKFTLVRFENGKYGIKKKEQHFTEFLDMSVGGPGYWWHKPAHVASYAQTRWKWRAKRILKRYTTSIEHVEIKSYSTK